MSNSSQSTRPVGRVRWKELLVEVIYYLLLPYVFTGYAFKGQVHVFTGQVQY